MPENAYTNILVVQTAFLGDLVLTTPLFRGLKRVCPEARLTLLTTPQAAPLVEEDPHLDDILTFDKKKKEGFAEIAGKLRSRRFDALVSAHRSHRTSIVSLLSGAPVRVGYAESGFACAYNRRVGRDMGLHEVDRILALMRGLGFDAGQPDRVLFAGYTQKEADLVAAILQDAGVGDGDKVAGLCPGSVWATKRWTPEGFAEVGRRLIRQGWRVVLIGGPDDAPVAAEVAALMGAGVINAAGKTPLKALAAWMDRLGLFVTNDSAPLHVAAARDVPTVAVFGATVKALGFYPFHARSRVVEADLKCRPCGLHGHKTCPEGHFKCMLDVTPDMVLAACGDLAGPL